MAVSRGKMLGHYSRGPGGYKCQCCQDPGTTRWRKRVERQEVADEVAQWADEALESAGLALPIALETWPDA